MTLEGRRLNTCGSWHVACPVSALTASSSCLGSSVRHNAGFCCFPMLPYPRDLSQSLGRPCVSSRTRHSTLETRGHTSIPEPKCGVHLIDGRLQEGWDVARQPPRVQNPCRHSKKMSAMFTRWKRAVWNNVSGVHPFVKSFCFTKEKEKKRKVKLSSEHKIS